MRKAIVTGATGFIGANLCLHLEARGCEVLRWTRSMGDLATGNGAFADAARTFAADAIFHLASAGVRHDQAFNGALIGSEARMAEACVEAAGSNTTVVIAGSMAEYGRAGVLCETGHCAPRTQYGLAKLAAGLNGLLLGRKHGKRVWVARIFGAYGPGEAANRLFPAVRSKLLAGEEVALSDGTQLRDFIHVSDTCEVMVRLADCAPDEIGIVNVGTGQGVTVREAVERCTDAIGGSRGLLRFGAIPRAPSDEDVLVADVARLRAITGLVPPQRLLAQPVSGGDHEHPARTGNADVFFDRPRSC